MGFDKEVLGRLPLANAVLTLWLWITEEAFVQSLFDKHRGACYEKQISFPVMVHLIADAILQHQGSGRKSFERAKETEQLTTSLAAAYQKLSRLPLSLSEAFLGESTQRLLEVFPKVSGMTLPSALQRFQMLALDGKVVKRVPRRLKVLLEHKGGVLGGKALAALDLNAGLVIGLASAEDGEVNDARLVPEKHSAPPDAGAAVRSGSAVL